jgi:hypothetical protein
MAKQDTKLNISDITFDDFIGDGLEAASSNENSANELENDQDLNEEDEYEEDEFENSEDQDDQEEEDDDDSEDSRKFKRVEDQDDDDDDDDSDEEFDGSVANTIAKALGYELENEYADTEEGLIEFTKDIAQNIAEDQIQELFSQFPLVQKHLDFVLAGGDPEQFFQAYNPSLDYNNIEIDQNDTRTQKGFIAEFFRTKGHDDEFIKEMLEEFEDSGKLYDKATHAKKQLAGLQAKEREGLVAQQRHQQALEQQRQQEFWEDIANRIDSGNEFAGIRIPDREKAKFFDYISAPVDKSGRTRRDVDYAQSNVEVKLALDYLMYKGLKIEDIINTKAKTISTKNLRDKIQGHQDRVKNFGKMEKGRNRKFDPEQLDMKRLFE